MAKRTKQLASSGELPEEIALRRLRARAEAQVLRAAMKMSKAQLATHAAAKVSRKTKDWTAPLTSADGAIIDDAARLNARARQLVRDSWIAKAAVRAKRRNIVGTGIIPVPAANLNGVELTEYNNTLESLFWDWASDRKACDVEGRSTFWKTQSRAVGERMVVGEHFIVWSYTPNPHFVGLQLQSFEPEQLNDQIQEYEGNEVRRGIEVDDLGRAVAYHFYERTPNDYLATKMKTIRIPAARVLHYFDAERAQQSHGVTELAPVMLDIRDFTSFKDATLFKAKMEACIGFIIKKTQPSIGSSPAGISPASGDGTTLTTGERVIDLAPGMVPELLPGEDAVPFMPASPGNQYSPFTEVTLRGIGAGTGLSYGALARKSDGNYSVARQDMLEDEREFSPEQDDLIDVVIKPVFELFTAFAVFEGRLPISPEVFNSRRRTFVEAEYVTPARPWIDPEKEANASEKLLQLRLITRKAIGAKMGYRQSRTIAQIAEERTQAQTRGITFPEDVEAAATSSPTPAQPDAPAQPGAAAGGTVNTEVNAEASLNGAQITAVLDVFARYAKGEVTAPVAVELIVAVGIPRDRAESMVQEQASVEPPRETTPSPAAQMRARLAVIPNYRATTSEELRCATCRFLSGMNCTAYDEPVSITSVCDAWECPPAVQSADSKRNAQPPGPSEGEPPFDQTSARDGV